MLTRNTTSKVYNFKVIFYYNPNNSKSKIILGKVVGMFLNLLLMYFLSIEKNISLSNYIYITSIYLGVNIILN